MPPYPKPVSQKQRGAMWAASEGKSNIGIPKKVGAEFAKGDSGGKLPKKVKAGKAVKAPGPPSIGETLGSVAGK